MPIQEQQRPRPAPVIPGVLPQTATITVRIGALPGKIADYELDEGATIREALEAANLPTDREVRVNGKIADFKTQLVNGDIVLVLAKVRGN